MRRSWEIDVARLCSAAWELGPHRTRKVIDELKVLIATDQLSDMAVVGILHTVGMRDPAASSAARSIRSRIWGAR